MTLKQQYAARHRKAPLAVSGTCRWVLPPLGDRPGILTIGETSYLFETLRHAGVPYGWRLTRQDARKGEELSYQLPIDLQACDCPDSVYAAYRPGGCKHVAALRVAIAALGTDQANQELTYGPAPSPNLTAYEI